MADRCDGLAGVVERAHQFEDFVVQPQVFRRTTAGNQQRVVIGFAGLGEIEIEREQVTGFFAVGLITFKIMNRSAHGAAGGLVRAHGVHRVADHLQGLERHHHFVVFDVIADQHQNLFRGHGKTPRGKVWEYSR